MNLLALNETQINQLFWVIVAGIVIGLLLAQFIKKQSDPLEKTDMSLLLANPLLHLGLIVFTRLFLIDSKLARLPPVVALTTLVFLFLTIWIMKIFPPVALSAHQRLKSAADDCTMGRNIGLFR